MCSMGLWWHTPTALVWQYPLHPGAHVPCGDKIAKNPSAYLKIQLDYYGQQII